MSTEPGGGGGDDRGAPPTAEPLAADSTAYAPSVAENLARYQRAGGIITPVITAIFAFFMGGIVVLATGHNPWKVYKGIFSGSGLNWFFHFGNYSIGIPGTDHHVWFWWNTSIQSNAAYNLQQTLLLTTTLILTGLAVAFAFRCGLFNIGGQGQYLIGVITGLWIGTSLPHLARGPHVLLAMAVAAICGALWAAIAGFLKATTGAHEVITTIMLNWIAYWIGSYLFGQGGPLQNSANKSVPVSDTVVSSAKLPVFWGNAALQGLHIGFFIAIAALVAFWFTLNRTTTGYEVRAVGFNPEAARYGGISVARNYILAMAISGSFAGLAGCMDMLGYQYRFGVLDVQTSQLGFIGIAVALLGRNKAIGVALSALLFAALLYGTSTRSIDQSVLRPELAGNLTLMIQALVLLFVGADVLILALWQARRRVLPRRLKPSAPAAEAR
ncbi:MAG: ral nucleoside transport system permease protein [Gaiellaceae bacterium]|nr:ral nucleoside transport system permease protein [Gaiellaceae bacterium]MDX6436003.1 ral nucleoside transport system permease protein [Gaiellaceae bacterium]